MSSIRKNKLVKAVSPHWQLSNVSANDLLPLSFETAHSENFSVPYNLYLHITLPVNNSGRIHQFQTIINDYFLNIWFVFYVKTIYK